MKHNYLSNLPLDEAKEKYFSLLSENGFGFSVESVASQRACGRVLSKAIYAKICSPHYNASAMDGIAIDASLSYGAAEQTPVILSKSDYTVVDTGDPLPENSNAVVMVEDITELDNGSVKIFSSVSPWQNVRQVGEDICMGDMIAPSMTKITASMCGAFLAGGVMSADVIKKPLFGIIPTGDEIVAPKENPKKGEIIEFNSTIFSSMLSSWDADFKIYDIVADKRELLKNAVATAAEECSAVLVLAGSSAGRDDYTSEIISTLGELCVHGLAAKPGKPAVLGAIKNVPVIGLPGYPVSAIVVMEQIVKGVIDLYYKRKNNNDVYAEAVVAKRIVSSLKYREFVRVTLGYIGGVLYATALPRGAGVITSFTKASGILEIPQNSEGFEEGEKVTVRLLKSKSEIEASLIVTGSHDPLIDEITDILKQNDSSFSVISSHVGSMGAISAIRSRKAHLGAIHLLDTESGEYNSSYVKRYFPDNSAVLIKGVGRVQGLMVQKGNPENIQSFTDAVKHRYVNRQRGAGTRILCDHLINKYSLDKDKISGYKNEEFTHTAVAALIAAGNADAGLGIYSAAKMYDLDFIPICNEEYDFLVSTDCLENEQVKAFFKVLHSEEFKKRLLSMGGYEL